MSSVIKVGKVQSSTGQDAVTIANDGSISGLTTNNIQPVSGQALTIKDEGGTASITVATNGEATFAENIKITANKGLSFQNHSVTSATGASSTTSNNILDDYEEGTWTPIIGGSGGQSGQSYSSGTQTGIYTKIGDLVCCQFYVTLSTKGTISGSYAVIGGLPFNTSSTFAGAGSIGYWTNLGSSVRSVGLYIPNSLNYAYITFETSGSTAGSTSAQIMSSSNIDNTTRFNGTLTYRTA
tara:strand:- start:328 stop:1044 length:717 start_codon:yes stop_codon:yes gene_type:complete